jgi:hypothetical protein
MWFGIEELEQSHCIGANCVHDGDFEREDAIREEEHENQNSLDKLILLKEVQKVGGFKDKGILVNLLLELDDKVLLD